MKIAVILTRFLKDYVESYFNSLSLDCELSYYIYNDFAHAGELYLELEKSYDGFLVSGPVPRAAICRRVPVLTKPIVSFGSNASATTRHFSRCSLKNRTFIWRGGISTCWNGCRKQFPCTSTWSGASLTSSYTRCTRTPPPIPWSSCARMEKKIKLKHIRLWNEKKIQYSVTRFSNIIQDLLDAGVNTYFVYPKYEILQESVTLLLQEIQLLTVRERRMLQRSMTSNRQQRTRLRRRPKA